MIARLLAAAGKRPAVCFGPEEDYAAYLAAATPSQAELVEQRREKFDFSPHFAVSVCEGEGKGEAAAARRKTLEALEKQSYSGWTLDMADDYDYIIYLLPGDVLTEDALYQFARAAQGRPDAMYGDQDETVNGRRAHPEFKPDVSEFTLLSYNCVGRPLAVSRRLHDKVGGLREESALGHYGYTLRVFGAAAAMLHIRRVLCSCPPGLPEEADGREHVERYLFEKGQPGCVLGGIWRGSCRVMYGKRCRACLVIADLDSPGLRRLLESAEHSTVYADYEIMIVDRGSRDSRTLKYYELLQKNKAARVIKAKGQGGLPAAWNQGAQEADAEITVFLDPMCELVSPGWLYALAEPLLRGAAAAGPKLTDREGRILYAGGAVGIRGWAASPYAYVKDDTREQRKNLFINTLRCVSVLSNLCLAVDTERFFEAGCFDESFVSGGAAEELCLRLYRRGQAVVYTPFSLVKSHSRPGNFQDIPQEELVRCYDVMRPMLSRGDPRYSPNFDPASLIPKVAPPRPAIMLNPFYKM